MEIRRAQTILKSGWMIACLATFGIFLLLSFYNGPSSDDYTYARWMREWGFADAQITIYYAWGGRYFSNILLTLFNSLSYSSNYKEFLLPYQLHSVVHIFLFVFSTLILFQRIRFIPYTWLALIPIAIFVQKASTITEFFYWMAGAVTYCSGYIFGAVAISAYVDLIKSDEGKNRVPNLKRIAYLLLFLIVIGMAALKFRLHKDLIFFFNHNPVVFLWFFGSCILLALIYLWLTGQSQRFLKLKKWITWVVFLFSLAGCAGSSELIGAILIVTLGFVWLGYATIARLKSVGHHLPILFSIIALAINVLAPATANRQGTIDVTLIHHWGQAFHTGFFVFAQSFPLIPLFFTSLFLSVLFSGATPFEAIQVPPIKAASLFIGYFLTVGLLLPVLIGFQSGPLPLRAINLHLVAMALALFIYAWSLGIYLSKYLKTDSYGLLIVNLALLAFFVVDPGRNRIRVALEDITSGEAASFLSQYKNEQQSIQICSSDTCEVPPITARPKSLWIGPNAVILGQDSGTLMEYKTYSYALFYRKKFIYQKPLGSNTPLL